MLTPAGVKVLDFGIAALAGQNSLDTHGQLWGTPAHLAPEQLRGEPTYPAADVYALGLLLFECLTGARAWPGTSVGEILAARHQQRAARLPGIAGLPREIIRLYEACVADDPTKRPPAAEVAAILRRAAGKTPTVRSATAITRTIPPIRRKRSRSRAAITASIAVAAAFASIIGLQVANGYSTPGGRPAEAAVDGGAPATRAPQPVVTPTPTSTRPVRDAAAEDERPARRIADTWTREATSPPPRSKPLPSSEAPTAPPTTPPAGPGPTPSDPPPTSAEPEQPSEPPATTEPTVEPTKSPQVPDPEDPPAAMGEAAAQNTVLTGV
jgi:serine/threonine-protein kinase